MAVITLSIFLILILRIVFRAGSTYLAMSVLQSSSVKNKCGIWKGLKIFESMFVEKIKKATFGFNL